MALRRHHALTGVIAPERWLTPIADALTGVGLVAVGHVQGLAADEVPVFGYELVKGLELDGVVVVSPEEVLDGTGAVRASSSVALDPGGAGAHDRDGRGAAGDPPATGIGDRSTWGDGGQVAWRGVMPSRRMSASTSCSK